MNEDSDTENDKIYRQRRVYNPDMMLSNSGTPILYCVFCAVSSKPTVEAHYVMGGYSLCQLHFTKVEGKLVTMLDI